MIKAIVVTENKEAERWLERKVYRCNLCGDMFGPMIHFEDFDFYACVPRRCPNCGELFVNGMREI